MKTANRFFWATLFLLWMQPSRAAATPDSLTVYPVSPSNIRGVEREERFSDEFLRATINVLLFVPREITNGLLFTAGRGLQFATNPDVIETMENILYFHKYKAGWYPLLNIDGDWNLETGAKLFYRGDQFKTSVQGKYVKPQHWKASAKVGLGHDNAAIPWEIEMSAEITEHDEREYYGIGNHPESDPRSHFLPESDDESGVYFQRLKRLYLIAALETGDLWALRWTSYVQERSISSLGKEEEDIDRVFDISQLAGVGEDITLTYSEIAVGFDTRDLQAKLPVGIMAEGYVGYSGGIDNDIRFLRSGFDLLWHFPVIKRNRFITPRLAFNMIHNLDDKIAIPFAEYPRHPTFRGVSSRHLLRLDNLSLVPTFEYRWPLTHVLQSCLFLDGLIVADEIDKLTTSDAPWAVGLSMNLKLHQGERTGFMLVFGSEGFRGTIYLGLPGDKAARSEWN